MAVVGAMLSSLDIERSANASAISENKDGQPRPSISEELVFDGGEFRVNFLNREVRVHNRPIHLTPKEFNLLGVLVRNAGRVITRNELVTEAWGPEYADAIDSLKLYIHYLRQKIEQDPQRPQYILTSRGVGYRFANR